MIVEAGIGLGLIAAAGAAWRGYKGYQAHMTKKKYQPFDWGKFVMSVVPSMVVGFVAGSTYGAVPELLTQEWFTLAGMFFVGGAGVGTLQGKLPFMKKK